MPCSGECAIPSVLFLARQNIDHRLALGRQPDQAGYDFWLGQIEAGQGKDDLLIYFADSQENISNVSPDIDDGIWVI